MSKYIYYDPEVSYSNRGIWVYQAEKWEQRIQWEITSYRDPITGKLSYYSVPVNPLKDKKLEDYL